ncbi:MAG: YciI family protein [Flavihumibacter sp.]
MKEFMMIFRYAPVPGMTLSPEQIQESIRQRQDWIGGIAAQGKFVGANRLGFEGKTLKADKSTIDGPYAELKEIVGGYVIAKAGSLQEAVKLAEGCPVFQMGGSVEVRDIMALS